MAEARMSTNRLILLLQSLVHRRLTVTSILITRRSTATNTLALFLLALHTLNTDRSINFYPISRSAISYAVLLYKSELPLLFRLFLFCSVRWF